jgi:ATP-dependent Lon protease
LVLLDEIDKVGASTPYSVPPTVALLNLLEPENSRQWYDVFLQTACDLSKLMFCATANSLRTLSKPLLSRFRLVVVPEPRPSDYSAIARGALQDVAAEWGLPAGTLDNLTGELRIEHARNAREVRAAVRVFLRTWADARLGRPRLH